ncbi:MAG: Fe-S cluster assembly protein SufD [Actinomycetota bacterium]
MTDTPTLGSNDAPWMASRRSEAATRLDDLSMPSQRDENWRYLDLDFDPALPSAPASPGAEGASDVVLDGWHGEVISIVDGFVTTVGVPTIAASADEIAFVEDDHLFATAFAAYAPGAALLTGDQLKSALLVDVQNTSEATTFPGVHIGVPAGSDASVIIRLRSTTDAPATVVPTITADVADNARLNLTIIQDWNYATRSLGRCVVKLQRDAHLLLSEIGLGAKLGRLHLDVDFVGNGSNAKVYGAYFGEDDQTLDYRYFMNHIGMHTRSDMFLKGAVEDDALSVFTGMIRIEETGQKTEAFQTNRNLILSSGASAQSVPNLEILANDVMCGHGSTVGPLDEDQRYYLMSRGLTPERADRLQVRGFFEEVVEQIPDEGIAAWARERINGKYVTAQEEGRV